MLEHQSLKSVFILANSTGLDEMPHFASILTGSLLFAKVPIYGFAVHKRLIRAFCGLSLNFSGILKLEFILRLKIKRNDWLLADTCPQAANHCILF